SEGALPSPEALQRVARRGAPIEAGLWELGPTETGWRRHRGLGLLSPAAVAWTVAGAGLISAAPPAAVALLAGVALGSWQLLSLALAGTPLAGLVPMAILCLSALACRARPVRWGPGAHADTEV
ncbi:MAG: hypothetical protein H6740_24345, partial [Alphaproteobacteria bacterium]|nr:hypothetical protein [Alphaproteobacteria bacterium]